MTMFGDLTFFGLLLVLLVPALIAGIFGRRRRFLILSASLLMDLLVIGKNIPGIIFFVIYICWEVVLIIIYAGIREKYGRNGKHYAIFLSASLLPMLLFKASEVAPVSLFQILGISYMTFKAAQIIIEIYDGLIEKPDVWDLCCFLLFFPCISSGPIDRSRRFTEDLHRVIPRGEYLDMAGDGLQIFLTGAVYKFVIGALVYKGVGFFEESYHLSAQIGYAWCYGIYLFFDFAGYTRMAVGAGYFFGIRTPDNFRAPFVSKDMREFWDRWHITLSHWFRDFLFTRFIMQALRHKWFKNRLQAAQAGFLVDMLVMGLWHGITVHYILYGLYHGLLLSLTEVFQKKSKFYKKYKKNKIFQFCSWAVTIQLVMFGFLIFSGHLIKI